MAKFYTQKNFKLVEYNDIEWIKQNKKYKRGVYSFNSDELPKCNICGSELSFIKRGKCLIIDKCLNENCISHNKGNDIKLKAFLPEYLYKEYKEKVNDEIYEIENLEALPTPINNAIAIQIVVRGKATFVAALPKNPTP